MFRNRKFLMIFSLLIAIGLWAYVMGEVDPQTSIDINGIKVEMSGEDSIEEIGLRAVLDKPKVISLTIHGKRSEVYKARKKGITAYIDVSSCNYGENTAEIEVKMPNGVRGVAVERISQDTAAFTVK